MMDFETQVLEAFIQLTPDQRQAAVELLRLLAKGAGADCRRGKDMEE